MSYLDPAGQHTGPFRRRNGTLEIRSELPVSGGQRQKITVVDAVRGWVLEQHVVSPNGARLASAVAREHRYDSTSGVWLPGRVEIQVPQAQLSLAIDVGQFQINQSFGNPDEMWNKPSHPGFADVDLANPNLRLLPAQRQVEPLQPLPPVTRRRAPATRRWY